MFPLLQTINHPEQLRALPIAQLLPLADELRQFIVESVSKTGGHLSSNLGTVELTLALHYVFQTPEDRIIWDVGHQTYAHKILTGRREWMSALRMKDGPSGFPRRVESPFDAFGTAHSSTSISAALGMAIASQLKKENRAVVAVIGDGALSGGMAFEAMNNVGVAQSNMLVILNDNEMSISPAVGALHKYLVRLLSSAVYRAAWRAGEKLVNKIGAGAGLLDLAHKAEEHLKGMITPSTLFEELGFNYLGPIDGHDLPMLLGTLSSIRSQMVQSGSVAQPFFLHLVTKKGQGYKLAESDPVTYHGVTQFDSKNGLKTAKATPAIPAKINPPTFTEVFSDWLCDMASADDKLVGITPAMREGSGLVRFAKEYPHRYFDVGIAEQHALTFAGGLACEGLHPVVAIYSTFLQRGYDQLIHDVVLQNLPVLLAIDRAGLVGADGATHAGSFDLTYLSCLPNMVVMAPADEDECRKMLTTGYYYQGPAAVRYPRGRGIGKLPEAGLTTLEIGKAELRRRGERILILAFGSMVAPACIVGEKINATVVNMRFVKPLDRALILELAPQHATIVTIEENALIGGAGSMVAQLLTQAKINRPLLHLGLPDRFIEHAEQKQQLAECGLDADSIEQSILQFTQD